MEAQAATPLPRVPMTAERKPDGRLERAHQATFDAKEMAKLVAHYFEMKAEEHKKQTKDIGRISDSWAMDASGMWAITPLVQLTSRADNAVEEAMR